MYEVLVSIHSTARKKKNSPKLKFTYIWGFLINMLWTYLILESFHIMTTSCDLQLSFFTENKPQPFQGYSFSNKRKILLFRNTEILSWLSGNFLVYFWFIFFWLKCTSKPFFCGWMSAYGHSGQCVRKTYFSCFRLCLGKPFKCWYKTLRELFCSQHSNGQCSTWCPPHHLGTRMTKISWDLVVVACIGQTTEKKQTCIYSFWSANWYASKWVGI